MGGGLRGGDFDGGEANQETRAGRSVVFDAERAVMFGDDAARDGEAQGSNKPDAMEEVGESRVAA